MSSKYTQLVTIKILLLTSAGIMSIPLYFYLGGEWPLLVAMLILNRSIGLLSSIGYHRWLTHKSFEPHFVGKILMLFGIVASSIVSPCRYVMSHRAHHKYTDTEQDPHSPRNITFFQMWLGQFNSNIPVVFPKEFLKDPLLSFVDKNYWRLNLLLQLTVLSISVKMYVIFTPLMFSMNWFAVVWLNYFAHVSNGKVGLRNLSSFSALFLMGEELHKNHHDYPARCNFGDSTRFDFGNWFVTHFLAISPTK